MSDIEVVREQLARQLYALGDEDEPTTEALAALGRIEAERAGHAVCERNMDAEIERLKAAYARLVERLRLATPQSLMAVTDAALSGQGER